MSSWEGFSALARGRRSVRRFLGRAVPREVLLSVLETAVWAPSAGNRQDWGFTVLTSTDKKQRLANVVRVRWSEIVETCPSAAVTEQLASYSGSFDWFADAPVVIVVSAKRPESFARELVGEASDRIAGSILSAGMAAQNILLAAEEHGLGACCLTGPLAAEPELKSELDMGKRRDLVCLIALGYPEESPRPPSRRPLEEVVTFLD